MTLPLKTERLTVRRFTYADIEDVAAFAAHPSVAAEIPTIPHRDREKMLDYVDTQNAYALFEPNRCVDLAVELSEAARVIGLLTVVHDGKRQCEIGWALGVDFRGRGLATEAAGRLLAYLFQDCDVHRVFAGTVITNARSWALMERLGMRREGYFVQAHPPTSPSGQWVDAVRYAMLKTEWEDRRIRDRDRPVLPR